MFEFKIRIGKKEPSAPTPIPTPPLAPTPPTEEEVAAAEVKAALKEERAERLSSLAINIRDISSELITARQEEAAARRTLYEAQADKRDDPSLDITVQEGAFNTASTRVKALEREFSRIKGAIKGEFPGKI